MHEVRTEVSEEDKAYYKSIITHDQAVVFIARILRATRCDIHYEGRPHHVDNALWSAYTELRNAQLYSEKFFNIRAALAETLK